MSTKDKSKKNTEGNKKLSESNSQVVSSDTSGIQWPEEEERTGIETNSEYVKTLEEKNEEKPSKTDGVAEMPWELDETKEDDEESFTQESSPEKKRWNFKILLPVAGVFLALVVYFGGFFYYSNSFLPNTVINGKDYSGKNVEYVWNDLETLISADIVLVGRDGTEESLCLTTIDYSEVVEKEEIQKIYDNQNSARWIFTLFDKEEYQVEAHVDYNQDALYDVVQGLNIVSGSQVVEPKDAHIEKINGEYTIVPEIAGNQVDTPELKKAILSASSLGETKILLEEKQCYKNPEVKADSPQLQETLSQLDPLEDVVLTLDFENTTETLDHEKFSPWINLGSSGLDFERGDVERYVDSLGKKYDTLNTDRQFQSSERGIITVGGGIYGWQIDRNKTTDQIIALLKKGESAEVKPLYTTYARTRGENDIGDTYFELDLTNQHMWLYVKGNLIADTAVVTGLPNGKRNTPPGIFTVWSKETGRYLEGEDYKLWVDYWMPIDWTGVGIHDAPWQEVFGGERYLVYGSHGCVNTPPSMFPLIFSSIEIGTPVVSYY